MFEAVVSFILLVFLAGIIFQFISVKLDNFRYPPLGQFVDIGDCSLHVVVSRAFKHGPTIILEAGNGLTSNAWMQVQPKIAEFANCISYDRVGFGWSTSKTNVYTPINDIKNLYALVNKLELPAPYILVGHSYGGMLNRLYAAHYPEQIVGIVLVDAYHEEQLKIIPLPSSTMMNIFKIMSIIGLFRLFVQKLFPLPASLPTQMRNRIYAEISTYRWIKTTKTIFSHANEITNQFHNLPVFSKPMIVISAGIHNGLELKFKEKIAELQKDLVMKSKNGEQIIAEKSGHNIPFTQPEIIIKAVYELVHRIS